MDGSSGKPSALIASGGSRREVARVSSMADRPLLNLAFVVADTRLAGAERQVLHHLRCLDPKRYHPVVVCLNDPGELAVKL